MMLGYTAIPVFFLTTKHDIMHFRFMDNVTFSIHTTYLTNGLYTKDNKKLNRC